MKTVDGEVKALKLKQEPTLEELLKHAHNPRGLGMPTKEPLPFFQKKLPSVGEGNIWISTTWWQNPRDRGISYCVPAVITANDEQTVYFKTPTGLEGYICSCIWCQRAWHKADSPGWIREYGYLCRECADNNQRTFIGHLGAILRSVHTGLEQTGGILRPHYWAEINRNSPQGLLSLKRNNELNWAVPEFADRPEAPLPPQVDPDDFWNVLRPTGNEYVISNVRTSI